MKISIVSDEISSDFATAVELGTGWGVRDFELRGVGENRVPHLSAHQKDQVRIILERCDARIVALSPGLFKFPFMPAQRKRFPVNVIDKGMFERWQQARVQMDYHLHELLPATIDYARELGVSLILAFGFGRGGLPPGPAPEELLVYLHRAAEMAGKAGMTLALEVEAGFWADAGLRTANLVRAVEHPALGVTWDPGNAIEAGDIPYPNGYEAVRGLVRHVHFKDAVRLPDGSHRYAVTGDIDWTGQIAALRADGYDGFISVETHMAPKVQSAKSVLRRLQRLIEKENTM